MEIRALKALLATLTASNVKRYELTPDGAVKLEFGDAGPQVPDADVEGTDELQLPSGVSDPRKALARVYERHEQRKRAA